MELVDGGTLRELLRERGPMPPHAVAAVVAPVLDAFAVAHRAGLVHRDVKPENILISDTGEVKIADFGLVRAAAASTTTSNSVILGTAAYLSPEQVTSGIADTRSDVYSTGVLMFELLTGTTPFTGDTSLSIAYQRIHDDVPRPGSRIPGVPAQFDRLVAEATHREPAHRFADAGEMAAALRSVSEQLELPSYRVPAPRRSAQHQSAQVAPARPQPAPAPPDGCTPELCCAPEPWCHDGIGVRRGPGCGSHHGARHGLSSPRRHSAHPRGHRTNCSSGDGRRRLGFRRRFRFRRRPPGALTIRTLILPSTTQVSTGHPDLAARHRGARARVGLRRLVDGLGPLHRCSLDRRADHGHCGHRSQRRALHRRPGSVLRHPTHRHVIGTDPAAGSRVTKGSTVALLTSLGRPTVPPIRPAATSQPWAHNCRPYFHPGRRRRDIQLQGPDRRRGGARPGAGNRVAVGSTVKVIRPKGHRPLTFPM